MEVELAEVRDFLADHAPFELLPAAELSALPRRCTIRYARRGSVVLEVGDRGDGLYVVRSGAVEVRDETGELVDRVGTGEAFGMSSLLEHRPTRYRCTAVEDTLLLVLEPSAFEELTHAHPDVATFYATTHHARLSRAIGNLQRATSGSTALGTRVGDLVTREPVTTTPTASVRDAAAAMADAGVSCILVVEHLALVGIVTDRDLRNRVLAADLPPDRPVRSVMTPDPVILPADALAFEALLEMVSRDIHHLPVVDDAGRPVGLVTTTDLVRLENANPVYLAAAIGGQTSLAGVVAEAPGIHAVLGQLVERDVSAADISRVATALGDAVRRRVVALVEEELVAEGLGPAPVPYSWVVLGSAARDEEGFTADQDHAIVLGAEPDAAGTAWFAALADRVTVVLEQCGWPRCPGDVMATNPQWRLTVPQWRALLADWSREPRPDAVLHTAVFHDMRHLAGDRELTEQVHLASVSTASPRLLGHLSRQALSMRPPLGFFRGFVLERHGEHRDTLDIKRPISAVVQLARIHALRSGSPALSTRRRLAAAATAGTMDRDTATELTDALELMSYLRLHHQAAQARSGLTPDNFLRPADLTQRQRRHLRDAFEIVRSAQQSLSSHLPPGFE
ncbi:putative nucleotidyltransferase substrate binding domain-containing protein [Nocardioides sp. T5]|uniref:putative nucleotidyltransferase substrate binding domain-containing protein n=1 Tax=Nocardioides sp. T5 TaxID=3400182 RepID=UPI003A84903D